MTTRSELMCRAVLLTFMSVSLLSALPIPAENEHGCGGRTLYARQARENDTGRIYSPDRLKWVKATRVEDSEHPDGQYMSISTRVGKAQFKTRLDGFAAEILWAPDSSAFAVNETEGGGGFDQRTYVFYPGRKGLEKIDVSQVVEKAFGHPVKCDLQIVPNTAIVAWLNPKRVLVTAEVVNVSVCEHMGTFLSYEVSLPDPKILARHTQAKTKEQFGRFLGCELQAADDRSAARWQNQKSR